MPCEEYTKDFDYWDWECFGNGDAWGEQEWNEIRRRNESVSYVACKRCGTEYISEEKLPNNGYCSYRCETIDTRCQQPVVSSGYDNINKNE